MTTFVFFAMTSCDDDGGTGPAESAEVGSIRVATVTSNPEIDPDGYTLSVDYGAGPTVAANGSVTFTGRSPGNHTVLLKGIDRRCTVSGDNPRSVSVTAGSTTTTTFEVACFAAGDLEVTTATSGASPAGYEFTVDGGDPHSIGQVETVKVSGITAGEHYVELIVPQVCSVGSYVDYPNPKAVTVPPGGTAQVSFDVFCSDWSDLVVTTVTTGASLDLDGYVVLVDGEVGHQIGVNESAGINVATGVHSVELTDLAPNCTVAGDNPRAIDVEEGDPGPALNIQFDVSCTAIGLISNQIVFTTNREGASWGTDIYVMDADGSNARDLTSTSGEYYAPTVSPDGSRIAFTVDYSGFGSDIFVMNSDGTGLINLTGNGFGLHRDALPAWSPDGTRIVFVSDRDDNFFFRIYVMNSDGSGATRLTNQAWTGWSPSWSPDGSRIVFATDRDGNAEIYVMNADGSGQTNLTNHEGWDGYPSWSPDGNRIVFATDRDGNGEIYVMNADGSGQTNLTNHGATDDVPSWSPDGSRILFGRTFQDGNGEVYAMNADGSGQTNLTNAPASYDLPGYPQAWR